MSNTDKPFASAGCGCVQKKRKCPHFSVGRIFLFTTHSKGNLILVSVANLVRQDFSHTLNKRLTPLQST